ncbi:MAG: Asp23/Gls24 family envelope stress response protein [Lachnospiraceae bacterium]
MKGKVSNPMGNVVIDTDVISKYAGLAAIECFGIVGMAAVSVKDGIVKLLKKDNITRGINVTLDSDNKLTIDFHVIISYGVSIKTVSENLIESVKYKVEEYTGIEIKKINIFVDGVRVID